MIRILGLKRIVWLITLLVVSAAIGAVSYYYLIPASEEIDKDLRTVQLQIGAKQAQIQELKVEFEDLKELIVKFNLLKEKGFFNAQDRVTARETISALSTEARLLKAELSLQPGSIVDDQNAKDANYALISGPMSIKVTGMDDLSIYKFVVALQRIFPGYLEFKSLQLKRAKELDKNVIKSIYEGRPEGLIEGEATLTWWSMASQKQLEANPFFNPTTAPPSSTPAPAGTTP